MNTTKATSATIEFLKKQPKFSVSFSDRSNGETTLCETIEEAKSHYDGIDVMDVKKESNSYWYNNKEGYSAELRELKQLPISLIEELNECETEEEMIEAYMYDDVHHTYAERIETKFSYLSDEWNNDLGENGEFEIKEKKVPGITYGTYFGKIEMISLSEIFN